MKASSLSTGKGVLPNANWQLQGTCKQGNCDTLPLMIGLCSVHCNKDTPQEKVCKGHSTHACPTHKNCLKPLQKDKAEQYAP